MTAPTHCTFAEFVYLLILTATGVALSATNAVLVAVFALLPDLDTGGSRIGAALPILSRPLERRFGHRTMTHSVFGAAVLGLLLSPLLMLSLDAWICCLAGFVSHAFLDTMTTQGVRLWYPFSQSHCVFPLDVNQPHRYRTQSGSRIDRALGVIFLLGCIPTYFIAQEGYERFIRVTQRTIESAVRDYNEYSRTNLVLADVSAHNLLTKEHLTGAFEIVGALNAHTLIFRGADGRLHTLGSEYQSEYAAESVICRRGKQATTSVTNITLANEPLGDILDGLVLGRESQVFGTVRTADRVVVPEPKNDFAPITGTGQSLVFNYAFAGDIVALGLQGTFVESGTLLVRTIVPEDSTPVASGIIARDTAARFVRVSFQVPRGDSLVLMVREGDTVHTGDWLARWGEAVALDASLAVLGEKQAVEEEVLVEKEQDLTERMSKVASERSADSNALAAEQVLVDQGFAARSAVEKLERKERTDEAAIQRLKRQMAEVRRRNAIDRRTLATRIIEIQSRRRRAAAKNSAQSACSGSIVAIHRTGRSTREDVCIVIREAQNGRP